MNQPTSFLIDTSTFQSTIEIVLVTMTSRNMDPFDVLQGFVLFFRGQEETERVLLQVKIGMVVSDTITQLTPQKLLMIFLEPCTLQHATSEFPGIERGAPTHCSPLTRAMFMVHATRKIHVVHEFGIVALHSPPFSQKVVLVIPQIHLTTLTHRLEHHHLFT